MTRLLLLLSLLPRLGALAPAAVCQPLQPPATQRLWQALRQHPQADAARVRCLNRLADARHFLSDVPAGERDSLAQQAFQLAQHLHDSSGQAYALYNRVMSGNTVVGNALPKPQLRAWLCQAQPLAEASGNRPLLVEILLLRARYDPPARPLLARAFALARATRRADLLGACYEAQSNDYYQVAGNFYRALQCAFAALRVAQQARLAPQEGAALLNIARRYFELGDYEQALRYLQQTIAKARTLPDSTGGTYLQGFALLYTGGNCYRPMGRYPQAIAALQHARRVSHDAFVTMTAQSRLADVYERQGRPQALAYAHQVLRETYRPRQVEQRLTARLQVCVTLGQHYLRAGRPDSAVFYGRQALRWTPYTVVKEPLRDAMQLLAQAYAQQQQFGPAYAFQRRARGLNDTLNNAQATRLATALRFTQDLAHQKNQIALLTTNQQLQAVAARRQRQLLFSTLAGLALLAGLGFALGRSNRQKQHANEQLQQLNAAVTTQRGELQAQRDQLNTSLKNLHATQAQLIQKEKMASLGELTAGIAHEIQNPLNFVNNFAELSTELVEELQVALAAGNTAEATALASDVAQNAGKITEHGKRAAAIVRGMLEHSRQSTGERAPTNLNALADEYLRLAYQGLRAKDKAFHAALQTDFAPGLPLVEAVGPDVGRALLNLFGNAFYAVQQRQQTGEAGYEPRVTVRTQQVGHRVGIRVADNGPGMSAAVQAKIFQPFFTTKPPGQGTGLGLSLAHDIIAQGHAGTLSVESQEGQGTTFCVALPLHLPKND